jgi:hypothetical protein
MSYDTGTTPFSDRPLPIPHSSTPDGVREEFVFDFRAFDDPDEGQRWSTWLDI